MLSLLSSMEEMNLKDETAQSLVKDGKRNSRSTENKMPGGGGYQDTSVASIQGPHRAAEPTADGDKQGWNAGRGRPSQSCKTAWQEEGTAEVRLGSTSK